MDPAAHSSQCALPDAAANDPAAQRVQTVPAALGCSAPAAHGSQVARPASGCTKPGWHGRHRVLPASGCTVPVAQGVQTVAPCWVLMDPTGQGKHPLPVGLNWPGGHPTAAVAPQRAASAPPPPTRRRPSAPTRAANERGPSLAPDDRNASRPPSSLLAGCVRPRPIPSWFPGAVRARDGSKRHNVDPESACRHVSPLDDRLPNVEGAVVSMARYTAAIVASVALGL